MSCLSIIKWLRTRVLQKKIMALWGLLLASCLLAKQVLFNNWLAIFAIATLSLLMITIFRLWDDMVDREFDRKHHPKRVLPSLDEDKLPAFYALAGFLFLLMSPILIIFFGLTIFPRFFLITAFMAAVYFLLPSLTPYRPLRDALVLLKYPAMLILLTGGQLNLRTGFIAGSLYGLLLTYECYDYLSKWNDYTR